MRAGEYLVSLQRFEKALIYTVLKPDPDYFNMNANALMRSWVNELRTTKEKQATGKLVKVTRKNCEAGYGDRSYCCLGIAEKITPGREFQLYTSITNGEVTAAGFGDKVPFNYHKNFSSQTLNENTAILLEISPLGTLHTFHLNLNNFLGSFCGFFRIMNLDIPLNIERMRVNSLVTFNDDFKYSFLEIADFIENYFYLIHNPVESITNDSP